MIHIEHLFISPGHNFLGHHGQPAGGHPIVAVDQIECVAGRGIRGDRFFDHKPEYKGQITFFAMETIEALGRELGLAEARPEFTRRNVFTRDTDLNTLVGAEFEIQGVRFAGTEECRPCSWMNHTFGDSRVEVWLKGRGGLRARILTDGMLRRDPQCGGDAGVTVGCAARLTVGDRR
jgi:MOSC domain-containing protein YiiM